MSGLQSFCYSTSSKSLSKYSSSGFWQQMHGYQARPETSHLSPPTPLAHSWFTSLHERALHLSAQSCPVEPTDSGVMVSVDKTAELRSLLADGADKSQRSKSPDGRGRSRSKGKGKGKEQTEDELRDQAFLKEAYQIVSHQSQAL